MPVFSASELQYLNGQRLARLATIGPDGSPHNRPVGFVVDPDTGTIDVPGIDNPATQKWRNVQRTSTVSLIVDDVVLDPWTPRALEIRGVAEALADVRLPGMPWAKPGVIRIHPRRIIPMGIEPDGPGSRAVPA